MQLHPRTNIVDKARSKLAEFMLQLEQEHDLTYGEMLSLLCKQAAEVARYLIRDERHPNNPSKKGDEA